MNWDSVEGNWEEFKGKAKKVWGKLTDDDLTVIRGKKQELEGKLQQRYGYAKEVAGKEIQRFLDECDSTSTGSCSTKQNKKDSSCCQ